MTKPVATTMGQAAGTATSQSIRTGLPANDLNTEQWVLSLRKVNAVLLQKKLSKKWVYVMKNT